MLFHLSLAECPVLRNGFLPLHKMNQVFACVRVYFAFSFLYIGKEKQKFSLFSFVIFHSCYVLLLYMFIYVYVCYTYRE